jgi:serine/threonine-protein kinase
LEARVQDSPLDERYHSALGLAYAGLGQVDAAVTEATRATELLPVEKDAMAGPYRLFDLAAVYARVGRTAEALAVLEQVLTIPSPYSVNRLRHELLIKPLHGDPAFESLLLAYGGGGEQ